MKKLILTRGLPASGKTTSARKQVQNDPNLIRLNRDDFRQMLFSMAVLEPAQENMVTAAQHGAVDNALAAGFSVIVDDTNFFARGVRHLMEIGRKHGAEIIFQDFTDVPLEECINRDIVRRQIGQSNLSADVGEKVIRDMHNRYIKGRKLPLAIPDVPELVIEPYVNDESKPAAFIFDIDGTLANMVDRSPYDWHRVNEDEPAIAIVLIAQALADANYNIIVTSGRDDSCRNDTIERLNEHCDFSYELFMRKSKDQRKDNIVKLEIFNEEIRNKYNIIGVFDDRNQVVDMWRSLGLPCLQVAPGDF